MRTDPHAARRNVCEHRIQLRSIVAVRNRIDPHEHAVETEQALAYRIDDSSA